MPVITHPVTTALPAATAGKIMPVEQVLKPGAVVDAQVIAAHANLVKIAISGMLLEVLSEVQLQPRTLLKLVVSQTADGLRLAIVDQQQPDQAARLTSGSNTTSQVATTTVRMVAPPLQPDQMQVRASAEPAIALQAAAVSQAARAAAPVQASLSPLFANLPVIVASPAVPRDVKVAAAQLLAARTNLTENLSSADVRAAFKASGVLLEASTAKGGLSPNGMPDLKAALTVFRQLVSNWSVSAGQPAQSAPVLQQGKTAQTAQTVPPPVVSNDEPATALPQKTTAFAEPSDASFRGAARPVVVTPGPADPLIAKRAATEQSATLAGLAGHSAMDGEDVLPKPAMTAPTQLPIRTAAEPAPPFRGSAPSVQPMASPSIDPDIPAPLLAARLLDQTDGALARQTLLQVASLPERFDAGSINQPQQRWAFEIPFATPQGTAVAQFEIAEDGGSLSQTSAPKRVWRARFTLDIETTGPVHALVSLVGGATTIRMWAERPDTAAQLRDNAQALDSALRLADLEPGDIVIQSGQPPQSKPALAGHFLDRAT